MRVLVLAEYYPRAADATSGIWAHRQAVAATAAGAEVRVLVLHRPLPPLAALGRLEVRAAREALRQPAAVSMDGLPVRYMRYLSPPRPWSYASWGAWAAPWLRRALARIRAQFPFELIHAHYAVPAGDAIRRAAPRAPLIVSVHGGDVYGSHAGSRAVSATLEHARMVLANSLGTARRCTARGAAQTRVVHLGTEMPEAPSGPPREPTLVTVGNLVSRKRHEDVIATLPSLVARHPGIRYVIVGDGPERPRLRALADSLGVGDRVTMLGRLPPDAAQAEARRATLMVMPSVEEAFGVAYVEAMAAGVAAIGCRGEDGPEEIAAAGGGIELVEPRRPEQLMQVIDSLLGDPGHLDALRAQARQTVSREFTWARCGSETVRAYEDVLGAPRTAAQRS